jgi:hypothetical protein
VAEAQDDLPAPDESLNGDLTAAYDDLEEAAAACMVGALLRDTEGIRLASSLIRSGGRHIEEATERLEELS